MRSRSFILHVFFYLKVVLSLPLAQGLCPNRSLFAVQLRSSWPGCSFRTNIPDTPTRLVGGREEGLVLRLKKFTTSHHEELPFRCENCLSINSREKVEGPRYVQSFYCNIFIVFCFLLPCLNCCWYFTPRILLHFILPHAVFFFHFSGKSQPDVSYKGCFFYKTTRTWSGNT